MHANQRSSYVEKAVNELGWTTNQAARSRTSDIKAALKQRNGSKLERAVIPEAVRSRQENENRTSDDQATPEKFRIEEPFMPTQKPEEPIAAIRRINPDPSPVMNATKTPAPSVNPSPVQSAHTDISISTHADNQTVQAARVAWEENFGAGSRTLNQNRLVSSQTKNPGRSSSRTYSSSSHYPPQGNPASICQSATEESFETQVDSCISGLEAYLRDCTPFSVTLASQQWQTLTQKIRAANARRGLLQLDELLELAERKKADLQSAQAALKKETAFLALGPPSESETADRQELLFGAQKLQTDLASKLRALDNCIETLAVCRSNWTEKLCPTFTGVSPVSKVLNERAGLP
mmetsp:Transcript_10959/g.20843  ORF Transcript_10959/g.20843 Transcript_10959/m.20843 type:complete len:350 (+) Transcript_10959:139-1188(+)